MNHPKADEEKRRVFQAHIAHYKKQGRPIIYLDESGFSHDMPRTHGYAPKGQRCFGNHDWGARGRTNAIGALINHSLLTVSLFNGTINTNIFTAWLIQDLVPKLPPNSIVVMDNASFHKSTLIKEVIHQAGHTLEYLPPYSPDLNPIEHKWAQVKSIRRKHRCSIDELFERYCA